MRGSISLASCSIAPQKQQQAKQCFVAKEQLRIFGRSVCLVASHKLPPSVLSICPKSWVSKWDEQREANVFAGESLIRPAGKGHH